MGIQQYKQRGGLKTGIGSWRPEGSAPSQGCPNLALPPLAFLTSRSVLAQNTPMQDPE